MRKVLVLADLRRDVPGWVRSIELLESHGFVVDDPGHGIDAAEAAARAESADAIIVAGSHRLGGDVLAAAPRVRIVSRQGVGYDNVDVGAATRLGILVCNTPGVNSDAVAEHAFALLLHLTRRIGELDARTRGGRGWENWPTLLTQLAGSTMAILGTGNIGAGVARRAAAFGMNVVAADLAPSPELSKRFGVRYMDLDEMLPLASVLSVHVPLTPLTTRIIDRRRLALLPPGAFLVNTARGGVVDEVAVAEAVREGRLAGAGFDVYETEPCLASPLYDVPGIALTPHVGGASVEAWTAMRMSGVENVIEFFAGRPRNAVNDEVLG